jgi:hypothetical protein
MKHLLLALAALGVSAASLQSPVTNRPAEQHDMALVGYDDLQGRSAYQTSTIAGTSTSSTARTLVCTSSS